MVCGVKRRILGIILCLAIVLAHAVLRVWLTEIGILAPKLGALPEMAVNLLGWFLPCAAVWRSMIAPRLEHSGSRGKASAPSIQKGGGRIHNPSPRGGAPHPLERPEPRQKTPSPLPRNQGGNLPSPRPKPPTQFPNVPSDTAMNIDQYSVEIPEGKPLNGGYVAMSHGTAYTISLSNHSTRRCDAEVRIDGGIVGTWRIEGESVIRLERPVHDTGRFTFFKSGTPEAESAGIVNGDQNGLITVTFYPEIAPGVLCAGQSRPLLSEGGTGLTGESDQKFATASRIVRDTSMAVQINLRLVAIDERPRPLFPRSNPIPPPVGE